MPGRVANPVWVDDDAFDLGYHVRRSALPRPGSPDQLRELVGRIVSRPLDRSRPLWEVYFVEGLADGQVALLYKTHQALVDGVETVDLGQVLLDRDDEPEVATRTAPTTGTPGAPPSSAGLLASALMDTVTEPQTAADTARGTLDAVLRNAEADRLAGRPRRQRADRAAAPSARRRSPARLSQQRRVVTVTDRPGRLPQGPRRPTAAPSTTSCWPPSPAGCGPG